MMHSGSDEHATIHLVFDPQDTERPERVLLLPDSAFKDSSMANPYAVYDSARQELICEHFTFRQGYIRLMYKNRIVTSGLILVDPVLQSAWVKISGQTVKDITPAPSKTTIYFVCLLLTLLLEIGVAYMFFHAGGIPYRELYKIILINIVTHPLLWFLYESNDRDGIVLFAGELMVVIAEAYLLRQLYSRYLSGKKAFQMSFLMNLASLIGGQILFGAMYSHWAMSQLGF